MTLFYSGSILFNRSQCCFTCSICLRSITHISIYNWDWCYNRFVNSFFFLKLFDFSLGIFASLLGSLFPLPRVLYAIASDGLIFRWIAWIHPRLQTPVVATVIGGVAAGK